MDYNYTYYNQVTCIDRQIAELEARRDALIHGHCYTGYSSTKPYLDPYGLDDKELWKIRYKESYSVISCCSGYKPEDKESDIRELTTSEAEEWLQQFHKDKQPYAGLFKLYHKKDGEWILYKEEK